ncbi:MAG: FtsX-like permease family protein, partial [Pseudomonadota bacterium]
MTRPLSFPLAAALLALLATACLLAPATGLAAPDPAPEIAALVERFASLGDRSTGTPGCSEAAGFIRERLEALFPGQVEVQRFALPVIRYGEAALSVEGRAKTLVLRPLAGNAMTPQVTGPDGLTGPLVYAGRASLAEMDGLPLPGAVVLMDLDSGRNWVNAVDLGAKALVYLAPENAAKNLYSDKFELTPVAFPRYVVSSREARAFLGDYASLRATGGPAARLECTGRWEDAEGENIWCLVPGTDPELAGQAVVLEAFYDSRAWTPGDSPGAEESLSMATLLWLAGRLAENPPGRSVLLAASSGHAQGLAGMREFVWALKGRSRDMRQDQKELRGRAEAARNTIQALEEVSFPLETPGGEEALAREALVEEAIREEIKTRVDILSQELMRLRLEDPSPESEARIKELAQRRFLLRSLLWSPHYRSLPPGQARALNELLPGARETNRLLAGDADREMKLLNSSRSLRSALADLDPAALVSLHLSSHGDAVGAFNQGFLYPLKDTVRRTPSYTRLDEILRRAADETRAHDPRAALLADSLRPSQVRPWETWFVDAPALSGEVAALAGMLGVTLATVNDARPLWGTPADRPETVDLAVASGQAILAEGLVRGLVRAPDLRTDQLPANGFSVVTGRARFIRHGELFPDLPAPGTVIQAYQGPAVYYAMVNQAGEFAFRGVADKQHSIHKVILEGYRLDKDTGAAQWAVDKNQTGKDAYRVKMNRKSMETDLVMFACRPMTLFGLLEPRSFRYMTRIQVLDSRTEADPVRFWYSRIDTRDSTLATLYLPPGTRMKLTLSDSVLTKKFLLLNADEEEPQGRGYLVDDHPFLHATVHRAATDMWRLLGPRVSNLENKGIVDERVRSLMDQGRAAARKAGEARDARNWSGFSENSRASLALASRVYDRVENIQKDVLFGVLFYIALFVPFAFAAERLLFSLANIHRRILAFLGILAALIVVIYQVHPAFELAYSPLVVILAFFILGLSALVSGIIFLRFEGEMARLQRRASSGAGGGRWKAFAAAFFLGVTNLRRRRMRTALTCITLVILTFTIMSFTAVKSVRRQGQLPFADTAPYRGLLVKTVNWQDLPPEAGGVLKNALSSLGEAAPRVWMEPEDRTRAPFVPVAAGGVTREARGLVGLSSAEPSATGLDRVLRSGRWFLPDEDRAVLLPRGLARDLGIAEPLSGEPRVTLWGESFTVVGLFDGKALDEAVDLDGEAVTPVIFPSEAAMAMTEVEAEAMESGEDVRAFQSRYQHVAGAQTVIVPARTLLSMGGKLKAVAVAVPPDRDVNQLATDFLDRFNLTLFSGSAKGVSVYHASDALSYSGAPNILVPLFISVFIVLNTMIGSVYERKREIGVYTSVGLAPSHVSFLFMAEAMAFGVLSVVLGYLAAQVSARLFAGTALWAGITVNYSSLAGVGAMALVMAVVMASTVYPARVAGRIAIPDVNRSWTLPQARGSLLEAGLPFL